MRRILQATVKRLALCKRGKNGLTTLFKSDGTAEWATLTKGDAAKGEVLAVAYPLGLEDQDGDFADTLAAIESMAHSFMREGARLDIEHEGEVLPREAAYVKESFLIQKGDERFKGWPTYDGKSIDLDGGWAVKLQIDDPNLRAAYQRGEWDGVSLFGPAAVEQVDIKAASQRVAARMGGMQEIEMTKEELQAAFAAQKAEITEMVKSALAGIVGAKPESNIAPEPKPESAPTFTGDPLDPQALADYERALRGHELRKAIADGTMTADKLAELRKSLSETEPTVAELRSAGIPANDSDSREVRALQAKLFKAQKSSNAPERLGNGRDSEEAELLKACETEGAELAKLLNERMGGSGMRVLQG